MLILKLAFSIIPLFLVSVSWAADGRIAKIDLGSATTEDRQIVNPATVFAPGTPAIYCTLRVQGVTPGARIRAVWIAEDTFGVAPANFKIDEFSAVASTAAKTFDGIVPLKISRPTKGWPVGKYRVEIYIGADLARAVPFTVEMKSDPGRPARVLQAELGTGRTQDLRLVNPGTSFTADTAKIVCAWESEGLTPGDPIRALWIALDTGGVHPPNFEVGEAATKADASFDGGRRGGSFFIDRPEKRWAPGRYRLEIYLRGILAKTVPFAITAK